MELMDTVALMNSIDYKDRFVAEYWQTKIRVEKLNAMLTKFYNGKLEFKPKCPIDVLQQQEVAMNIYVSALEVRAKIEHISLYRRKDTSNV